MRNTPAKRKGHSVSGTGPTFLIKVVCSENFSIQGYIHWIEEGKTVPFRSYMEMLHLIEEGLLISKTEMTRLRSWELSIEEGEGGSKKSGVL